MQVGVSIPGKSLESSGSIILAPGEISFTLSLEDVIFSFVFVQDSGTARFTSDLAGPKALSFQLHNWDNQLGVAHSFANVGNINGKQTTISLYVQTIAATDDVFRLINYSIYSGGLG